MLVFLADFGDTEVINTEVTTILIGATAFVARISPSDTWPIIVTGNTVDDFDNDIVASWLVGTHNTNGEMECW